eukprot:TRINITY_DN1238_c0_g2_i1.p1 TRINITY_DN1238_c0_g2~~TRINITY_DN1238_c0_g2_i1.p1  ORF type:complete len:212 (-),score=6.07 TRINITY_DN1238_c0_g2_i1:212-847(-)
MCRGIVYVGYSRVISAWMASIILHVGNIPCKILEEDFADTIHEVGLDVSRYSLFFPKRIGRQGRYNNYGYGFVECSGTEDAQAFSHLMQGFRFQGINSSKELVIEYGNSNQANVPAHRTDGQRGDYNAYHALSQSNDSLEFMQSHALQSHTASLESDGTSVASQNRTLACADLASLRSSLSTGTHGPQAHEVPPTRLVSDEEQTQIVFRYQ